MFHSLGVDSHCSSFLNAIKLRRSVSLSLCLRCYIPVADAIDLDNFHVCAGRCLPTFLVNFVRLRQNVMRTSTAILTVTVTCADRSQYRISRSTLLLQQDERCDWALGSACVQLRLRSAHASGCSENVMRFPFLRRRSLPSLLNVSIGNL